MVDVLNEILDLCNEYHVNDKHIEGNLEAIDLSIGLNKIRALVIKSLPAPIDEAPKACLVGSSREEMLKFAKYHYETLKPMILVVEIKHNDKGDITSFYDVDLRKQYETLRNSIKDNHVKSITIK
jgi:hypothetical protein